MSATLCKGMSQLTEALGTPHTFTHGDKTYNVSLVTQNIKAKWEKHLFSKCKEASMLLKDVLTPQEWADQVKNLIADYVSGQFAFESAYSKDCLASVAGMISLCSMLFGVSEDEMQSLILARKGDLEQLLKAVIHDSFPTCNQ